MKLVRRLTLYLLVAIGLALTLDTYLSLVQHMALLDADLRRDERLMGRALGTAVERAWHDRGSRYALDLVREANDREGHVRIRFVLLDATPDTEFGPDAPQDALQAVRDQRVVSHIRDDESEQRLYTYVPIAIPDQRSAALELSESLTPEREYLTTRIRRRVFAVALMALACGAVAWIVGLHIVGRPIRCLVEQAAPATSPSGWS